MEPNIRAALRALNSSADSPEEMIFDIVANTPSGIVPGKDDRVWTGFMQTHGSGRVSGSNGLIVFEFGWLDNDGLDYIAVQEFGGELPGLKKDELPVEVSPMNALQKIATLYMEDGLAWQYIAAAISRGWKGQTYG